MSVRAEILDAARQAVTVDRAATHGRPEDTFGRIAGLWSAYLGAPVSAVDAALMLGLLKIARAKGNPSHRDNFVDLAGYAACAGELAGTATDPGPDDDKARSNSIMDAIGEYQMAVFARNVASWDERRLSVRVKRVFDLAVRRWFRAGNSGSAGK